MTPCIVLRRVLKRTVSGRHEPVARGVRRAAANTGTTSALRPPRLSKGDRQLYLQVRTYCSFDSIAQFRVGFEGEVDGTGHS